MRMNALYPPRPTLLSTHRPTSRARQPAPAPRAVASQAPAPSSRAGDYLLSERPFARGAFAEVSYAVNASSPHQELVAKTLWVRGRPSAGGPPLKETPMPKIQNEVEVMKALRGPLQLVQSVSTPDHTTLLMTRMPGQVEKALAAARGQERRLALRSIFADVAENLQQLHESGYMHLDIKVENMLFDRHGAACAADFGCAEPFAAGTKIKARRGSPHVMAPEVAAGAPYDTKAEVWSLFAAWATAVKPRNYFSAAQAYRTAADQLSKTRDYFELLSFTRGEPFAKQRLSEAQGAHDTAFKHLAPYLQGKTPVNPYEELDAWLTQHPGPIDIAALREAATSSPLCAFLADLHDFDPQLLDLGLTHILHNDPDKRISMEDFASRLRALHPVNSEDKQRAKAWLQQHIAADTSAQGAYENLRAACSQAI